MQRRQVSLTPILRWLLKRSDNIFVDVWTNTRTVMFTIATPAWALQHCGAVTDRISARYNSIPL